MYVCLFVCIISHLKEFKRYEIAELLFVKTAVEKSGAEELCSNDSMIILLFKDPQLELELEPECSGAVFSLKLEPDPEL